MITSILSVLLNSEKTTYPLYTCLIIVLLPLSLLTSWECISQSKVDSLVELNNTLQNEDKVNNLINISREYFIAGDTISIQFARQAAALSNRIDYKEGIGKGYLFIALGANNVNVDTALKYFLLSGKILQEIDHPWAGFGFENGANSYRIRGLYPEALANYLLALKVHEKSDDTVQICKTISCLGHVYYWMNDHNSSIEWQKKALNLSSQIDDPSLKGLFLGRIGISFDEMGNYDSAHYYNQLAVELFKKVKDDYYLSQWFSNIGNTYQKQRNFIEAEKYISYAIDHAGNEQMKTSSYTNLANVYINTGKLSKASGLLDSAYITAVKYKQNEFLAEIYFRKSELYEKQQDYKKALAYYNDYFTLKDSILNAEKISQIADMRIRYETELKENQLLEETAIRERLEKDNALSKVAILNRNRIIIILFSLSVVAVFFILFVYQRKKRKLQAEKDAAIIKERELGILSILVAQEDERIRIAKDLHDGICQQISAIKLHFSNARNEIEKSSVKTESHFDRIEKMISDVGTETRSISHQMMPKSLIELGFIDALSDMLDNSFTGTNIVYSFEHHNIEQRLPKDIETGLYRISQELVNNIIKHSKATSVNIQLMKMQNNCIYIIQDDGIGISDKNKNKGIGILNITNRLRTLNGYLDIDSTPNNGTTFTIRIAIT